MPRPLVGLHPEAIAEAAAAATWYRERSESAALAFLKEFDRAIDRIAAAPREVAEVRGRDAAIPNAPVSLLRCLPNRR